MTAAPVPSLDAPSLDAPPEGNRQLLVLTALLQIERRARAAASVEEFGFLAVNETLGLVPYRQAVLWSARGRLVALSGVPLVDRNAPYALWIGRVMAWARATHGAGTATPLTITDLPPELARDWADWLPPHALWLPLGGNGALFLAREAPWSSAELTLLGYVADAYAHAWGALEPARGGWRLARHGRAALVGLGLALAGGAMALPMPQSALAPAEVIARAPTVVRAPIDGVVDRFAVAPNEAVTEGQLLLVLDRTRLQNRLEVARKAQEVAEAEHRQASQQALFDPRSKANLAMLKGRVDQQAAEVAYVEELLSRVELRAPRSGLAIFDDVNDWIGKPVSIGERILTVANPRETELEIRMPVADAIALEIGAEVRLFLNVDPQRPIPARLSFTGYQSDVTPDGVLAYRLKAEFPDGTEPPRIGLKGVAKVYGEDSTLGLALLRRPLAALRQRLGL